MTKGTFYCLCEDVRDAGYRITREIIEYYNPKFVSLAFIKKLARLSQAELKQYADEILNAYNIVNGKIIQEKHSWD